MHDYFLEGRIKYLKESVEEYKKAVGWNYFTQVVGVDFSDSGVRELLPENSVRVSGGKGFLYIKTPSIADYAVYDLNGIQIAEGEMDGGGSIDLSAGPYIVKVNSTEHKVIVK